MSFLRLSIKIFQCFFCCKTCDLNLTEGNIMDLYAFDKLNKCPVMLEKIFLLSV